MKNKNPFPTNEIFVQTQNSMTMLDVIAIDAVLFATVLHASLAHWRLSLEKFTSHTAKIAFETHRSGDNRQTIDILTKQTSRMACRTNKKNMLHKTNSFTNTCVETRRKEKTIK